MARNLFTMDDDDGNVRIENEYGVRNYVTFNMNTRETNLICNGTPKAYPLGELLIDFITLDDDGLLSLYEEDRQELLDHLGNIDASDFDWDRYAYMPNEYVRNYLKQNNISLDAFAKKVEISQLLWRHEGIHPYFQLIDLYTSILPADNETLLKETLNLKLLKEKATEIVRFCLDIETEKLGKLTAIQRYFYYYSSGRGRIPQNFKSRIITLPNRIPLNDYPVFYKPLPIGFDVSMVWELTSLSDLKTPQDITDGTIEYLQKRDIQIYKAYEINSFADIIYLELFYMILNNVSIKRCEWCGKYFVLKGDYVNKYCSRLPFGKQQPCRQLGSSRDFQKRVKKSEANVQYMRAYKRMHSRIKYGMLTKEGFKKWNMEAVGKTQLCEAGELSMEEFKKWMGNQ